MELSTNIGEWRTKHAQAWLVRTIELPQYVDGFQKAAIDGTMLATYVTEDHLRNVIGTSVQYSQVIRSVAMQLEAHRNSVL